MKMRGFLGNVYRDNRKGFLRYVLFALMISMMMWSNGSDLFAEELLGDFGENALARNLAGVCAPALSMGVEPFTCLTLLGIFVRLNDLFSWGFNTSSYIMGNDVIFVIVLCMCVLSKLAKSFGNTKILGMVTLDQIEEIAGPILLVFLTIATISGGFTSTATTAEAAEIGIVSGGVKIASGALAVLYGVVAILIAGVVYFVIRTVFFSLDVLTMALGFIPGFSALYETAKTLFITGLTALSIFFPEIAFAVNLVIFLISLIFFRKAYLAIRYFRSIYVRPFFKRIGGYDEKKELVYHRIPGRIRKLLTGRTIRMCIPVYSVRKYTRQCKTGRYAKWWLVVDGAGEGTEAELIGNRGKGKKRPHIILRNTQEEPVFYHETIRYIEFFTIKCGSENVGKAFKRVKRDIHFVISKEYHYKLAEIASLTGYMDYGSMKQDAKQKEAARKQQEREEKARVQEESKIGGIPG